MPSSHPVTRAAWWLGAAVAGALAAAACGGCAGARGGGPKVVMPDLLWNVWTEAAPGGSFAPLRTLKPLQDHVLFLDLASLRYADHHGGIVTQPAGPAFYEATKGWLDRDLAVPLTVMMVADRAHFEVEPATVRRLTVDLAKIRALREKVIDVVGSPFAAMAAAENPEFLFGRVAFPLRTTAEEGPTAVTLLLWANQRAVEEIRVPLCVDSSDTGGECPRPPPEAGASPTPSVRLAAEAGADPDASLLFYDQGDREGVRGAFRRREWAEEQFVYWSLGLSGPTFLKQLKDTYLKPLSQASSETSLGNRGAALFDFLFPDDARGQEARRAFLEFAEPVLRQNPFAKGFAPPELFVRMMQAGPDPPLAVPLGLVAPRVDGKPRFLGYSFRIQSPLERQGYEPAVDCITDWVMALPPADTGDSEIERARSQLGSRIAAWAARDPQVHFTTMRQLGSWLGAGESSRGVALAVVSHHADDMLFFYPLHRPDDDPLIPAAIHRQFTSPSLAVLNACGGAAPGSAQIVRKLNRNGVATVIAAHTEVSGYLAGGLLRALAEELGGRAEGAEVSISHAYLAALHRLRLEKPEPPPIGAGPYGANVLKFSLLGNGNLRVCAPVPTPGVTRRRPVRTGTKSG